jgi:hypothetical protein
MLTIESSRPSAFMRQLDLEARKMRAAMNQIVPYRLWLGHAGDYRQLFDAGIHAVVHLAAEESPSQLPRGLLCCHIPLVDGPGNDPAVLDLTVCTVAALIQRRLLTLVCCGTGTSRSAAVAAAALAKAYGGCPRQWLHRLSKYHPLDVSPGLWADLAGRLLE